MRVKFLGKYSHEELIKKMQTVKFFVLPSFSDVGPNVVAEAIGAKTPVIMTKESGYAEHVAQKAILIDPHDETDIQKALQEMMNEETRQHYAKNLGTVAKREWDEVIDDWQRLFLSPNLSHISQPRTDAGNGGAE